MIIYVAIFSLVTWAIINTGTSVTIAYHLSDIITETRHSDNNTNLLKIMWAQHHCLIIHKTWRPQHKLLSQNNFLFQKLLFSVLSSRFKTILTLALLNKAEFLKPHFRLNPHLGVLFSQSRKIDGNLYFIVCKLSW